MFLLLMLLLVFVAVGGGAWGHTRFGAVGWSPLGLLCVVLVVMYLTGHLPTHFRSW